MPGGGHTANAADPVRGLAVASDGLRLVVDDPELRRGRTEPLRFRIVDDHGADRARLRRRARQAHAPDRRPPRPDRLPAPAPRAGRRRHLDRGRARSTTAGSYRLFADFAHDGEPHTLATDLRVDGAAELRPLPAPQPAAVSDGGYDVRLDAGAPRPAREADLRFTITRDGAPVSTEPYLGAGGHLVALREGDLAFLHVHPTERRRRVGFAATFPTEGRYRLFLQFQHEGRVQTVAFTQEVS